MITFLETGNIFHIEGVYSYAHGCNCVGAMGKGIALQFKNKFPDMYKAYKSLCGQGRYGLGDVYIYKHSNGFVFNLATQQSWKTKASVAAIEESVEKMLQFAIHEEVRKIALPKIGAGLGGLEWVEVKDSLISISKKYSPIELFVVENYKE